MIAGTGGAAASGMYGIGGVAAWCGDLGKAELWWIDSR